MTACGYISDGYTVPFYIAEIPRLYPALRGKMRAMLQQERARVTGDIRRYVDAKQFEKAEQEAAKAVAGHVLEWDLRDEAGCQVAVSPASILRLQPALNEKLFFVVTGSIPSDEDPESDLVVTGKTNDEEADAKN